MDRTYGRTHASDIGLLVIERRMDFEEWIQSGKKTAGPYVLKERKVLLEQGGGWSGFEGYCAYAKFWMFGNLESAYNLASVVLTEAEFALKRWKLIRGSVSFYERMPDRLFGRAGPYGGTFLGPEGRQSFANEYTKGDTQKAMEIAYAVLTSSAFRRLRWGKYSRS